MVNFSIYFSFAQKKKIYISMKETPFYEWTVY